MSDVRNLEVLNQRLSLIYLFGDQVNVACARRLIAGKSSVTVVDLLRHLWRTLPDDLERWWPPSEIRYLFRRAGTLPKVDRSVIEDLLRAVVHPAKLEFLPGSGDEGAGDWRMDGKKPFPVAPTPESLREPVNVYEVNGVLSFSSQAHLENSSTPRECLLRVQKTRAVLVDELLDPLSFVRTYLVRVCGVDDSAVSHYIQQWLIHVFGIVHDRRFRYAVARVCDRCNELFYGKIHPNQRELRTTRTPTVGTALLIEEIADALRSRRTDVGPETQEPSAAANAVGIYLFMRARNVLRVRYHAIEAELRDDEAEVEDGSAVAAARELDEESGSLLRRASHQQQCVSVLRPLEYTFLLTAMLGLQTSISGLSFIFRGGLLPRPGAGRSFVLNGSAGSGKTLFALQFLADVAAKGGVSVYFSFEEDYNSIVDRLVTFDLYRSDVFDVAEASSTSGCVPKNGQRGCLLLYRVPGAEQYSLPQAIESMAVGLSNRLHALAIDSVNALHFTPKSGSKEQPVSFRTAIHQLVHAIENNGWLGFLLSEKDDTRLEVVPYLVDTVLEMRSGIDGEGRRIEIKKCRTQNFQHGPHPFRLTDRQGITIYPSLGAVRSSLRRRIHATLSERRGIPLPAKLAGEIGIVAISEKSSVLIAGEPGSGKTLLALQLLTESFSMIRDGEPLGSEGSSPENVLVVTFNTSEVRFGQMIRRHPGLEKRWDRTGQAKVRWYSPGGTLTGDQIVAELRKYILDSKRYGLPLNRILFEETELAEQLLPALRREPLFWPTVLELVHTEALTSIFVVGGTPPTSALLAIEPKVDYSMYLRRAPSVVAGADKADGYWLEMRDLPHLTAAEIGVRAEFFIGEDGLIM